MRTIVLISWMVASLYFCIGGITDIIIAQKSEDAEKLPLYKESGLKNNDGDWFRNIPALEANDDYEKMISFYPAYRFCGETFSYIITLMAFGILGSVVKILIAISFGKDGLKENNVYTLPVLGGLLGLLVLVLSELLPEFKYKSGNDKLFFSTAFLAGLFTKEFFVWLEKKFERMLGSKKEK